MFSYNVSKTANNKAFNSICSSIESNINIKEKANCLYDVDGSQIQIYETDEGLIKVYNDYEVDAVYIDSEVNLEKIKGVQLTQ